MAAHPLRVPCPNKKAAAHPKATGRLSTLAGT